MQALTPDYTFGCKRVLISNDWFRMFNRPNVELVTNGIREIRSDSIVTDDGVERPVDCIILGTGFVVDPRIYMQHFPITGLPGHTLTQDWRNGARGVLRRQRHRLPEPAPAGRTEHRARPQLDHLHDRVPGELRARLPPHAAASRRGLPGSEAEAQARFNERVQKALRGTVWSSGCASYYRQSDGRTSALALVDVALLAQDAPG